MLSACNDSRYELKFGFNIKFVFLKMWSKRDDDFCIQPANLELTKMSNNFCELTEKSQCYIIIRKWSFELQKRDLFSKRISISNLSILGSVCVNLILSRIYNLLSNLINFFLLF